MRLLPVLYRRSWAALAGNLAAVPVTFRLITAVPSTSVVWFGDNGSPTGIEWHPQQGLESLFHEVGHVWARHGVRHGCLSPSGRARCEREANAIAELLSYSLGVPFDYSAVEGLYSTATVYPPSFYLPQWAYRKKRALRAKKG